MIKQFETFASLCAEIRRDKADKSPTAGRYPVRLILLNDFKTMFDLADYLSGQNTTVFHLDSLLEDDEQWLTRDEIVNTLKDIRTDTLVIPLSEILRFFPENLFTAVMISIFEIENLSGEYGKRIYIPLAGLKERVEKDFLKIYPRKSIWSPVWHLDTAFEKKKTIYQIAFQTDPLTHSADIKNIRDWLNLWKKSADTEIISVSPIMDYLYQHFLPDALFILERIRSPKEYLEKIKGISIPAAYANTEKQHWQRLTDEIGKKEDKFTDFSAYVHCQLNINNLKSMSANDLLTLWIQNDDPFERWLLKHCVLSFGEKNAPYLYRILSAVRNYSNDEIISKIWFEIFDMDSVSSRIAEERKSYLHVLHRECHQSFQQIEEKIRIKIRHISDNISPDNNTNDPLRILMPYISGISFEERKFLVELIAETDDNTLEKYRKFLQSVYPELYHYLNWNDFQTDMHPQQDWVMEYFGEYNLSKLRNRSSGRLVKILKEKNADENSFYQWYYAVESDHDLPEEAFVIWIDGLGAEWFPLLEYLIESGKDRFVEKKYIRKVNLPTVTACNRPEHSHCVRDMDTFIHNKNSYTYPDDLIKQIDLMKKIVLQEIMGRSNDRILITSDHGFTALAQKQFGNQKKFDFSDADHEGRCMWTEKEYQSDTDFIVHTVEEGKKAVVALRHTSLYNTPCREVHGGATPEEVLVPCMLISKIQDNVQYTVRLMTKEISVKNPIMKIEIEPEPPVSPYLIIEGEKMKYIRDEDNWQISLKGFKAGTYPFCVEIIHQKIENKIRIKGGIQEKELF